MNIRNENNRIEYKAILLPISKEYLSIINQEKINAKITPPQDGSKLTPQDEIITPQIKALIEVIKGEMNQEELRTILGFTDRKHFRDNYIITALKSRIIELTIPNRPTSKNQKYRLTALGLKMKR